MPAGSMFLAFTMLWLGLLGSLDFAELHGGAPTSWNEVSWELGLTITLNLGSFVSFYALLISSTQPIIDATGEGHAAPIRTSCLSFSLK